MDKVVIINADDYGLTSAVSRGIRHAFREGILTSTTVMASGLTIDEDLPLLMEECSGIGIGVHLTVTNFKSTTNPKYIQSLVNQHGNFYSLIDRIKRKAEIDSNELYIEWKSQVERIISFGVPIDHLDSHHYTSFLSQTAFEVTLRLSKEYNLPIRTPFSPDSNIDLENLSRSVLTMRGIKYPDRLFVDLTSNSGTQVSLNRVLNSIENGCTEILSHPGYIDDDLKNISSYVEPRLTELNSLCSDTSKRIVIENNIQLSTFGKAFL